MEKDRFLDDFKVGEIFLTEGITITESEIIRFAMQFDPQSFHLDVTAALKSPYKGLIASGFHALSICFRMFIQKGVISVITSYSIHYTKLYDPVTNLLSAPSRRISPSGLGADFVAGYSCGAAMDLHHLPDTHDRAPDGNLRLLYHYLPFLFAGCQLPRARPGNPRRRGPGFFSVYGKRCSRKASYNFV